MFFKGTERRPSAREIAGEIDAIGGEFNAFTGKEYTTYYVKCAAEHRDVALDVLVDMLRNSRFDAGGDRAREGRDRRGDEHVLRHAARLHRRRLRDSPLGRPAARPGHHRHARRRSAPRRARRSSAISTSGTSPRAWCSASRAASATGCSSGAGAARRPRGRRDRRAGAHRPVRERPRRVHTKQSEQAHVMLGVPSLPLDDPDRYAIQLLATALGGGMSSRLFTRGAGAARARVLRLRAEPQLHRRRHALLAGGRRHRPHRRRRGDDRRGAAQDRGRAAARRGAREGAQLREGPLRPPAREPAGTDDVRAAERGARADGFPIPTRCWPGSTR